MQAKAPPFWTNIAYLLTGLIAAASGQLETLLQPSSNIVNPNPMPRFPIPKKTIYHAKKPLDSLVNGYFANGNVIHTWLAVVQILSEALFEICFYGFLLEP